jgi:pimeloyl-ACP methyl ester carboxylesterase
MVVLVGQSLGGYVAQHIYRQAPERVRALVQIGTTPVAKAYSKLDVLALRASLPLFRLWPFDNLTRVVARTTARTPAAQTYALEAIRRTSRDNFVTIWEAVSTAVNETGWPGFRVDVPLLLVHGDRDTAGSIRRDMPAWAADEPTAEYHVIPSAGHNANQDNPALMNELLLSFLERALLQ